MQSEVESGVQKAVRLAGSQTALANIFGVTPQAVQKWVEQGYAPADRCRPIEEYFDGKVTRYELNREIFGDAPAPSDSGERRRKEDELPSTSPPS